MKEMTYEKKTITSKDLWEYALPGPGLLMINKDRIKDKHGNLVLPDVAIQRSAYFAESGVIVAVSPIFPASPYENYLAHLYRKGDWVCFKNSTPLTAPIPPFWDIVNPKYAKDATVLINVCDIIEIIRDTPAKQKEFGERLDKISKHFWKDEWVEGLGESR